MVAGMALFTLNDAMGKWLVETLPVPLILAVRSAAALLILLPLVLRAGFSSVFRVPDPGRHLLRIVLIIAEVAFFYLAVRELPLADVMTIYMAAPLLVTALSVPLLGEKVGFRRWIAVGVGFVGVVLVLRPGGDFLSAGTPIALAGSLTFALTMISTRSLRGAGGLTLITTQTLGVGVAGAAALPFVWVTPSPAGTLPARRAGRRGPDRPRAGQQVAEAQPGGRRRPLPVHLAGLGDSLGLGGLGRRAGMAGRIRRGIDHRQRSVRLPPGAAIGESRQLNSAAAATSPVRRSPDH